MTVPCFPAPSPLIPLPCGERASVARSASVSSTLHQTPYSRALLAIDRDVDEGRDADQVKPAGRYVAARYGDGFDRLVDGARTDCLDLNAPLAPDDARYGAGDRHR